MKRFIFLSFIFLGWVFYVASGGADYAPRPGSLQARVVEEKSPPVRELSELVTPADENTVTALADIILNPKKDRPRTLGSAATDTGTLAETADPVDDTGIDTAPDTGKGTFKDYSANLEKVAVFNFDAGVVNIAVTEPAVVPVQAQPRNIREVTGNVVNMRMGPGTSYERVGKVLKGAEIEVLEDPGNSWISILVLDTGETGWIADWLTTAAN